ncbi:MAG: PQQ-binding-like beta-propeller repeat protein [Candidatus Bathyarchaeia archaeon]
MEEARADKPFKWQVDSRVWGEGVGLSGKTVSAIMMSLLVLGTLATVFDFRAVRASGTIYITADGSIDSSTAPIHTADNITYTLTGNITSVADGIVIERDNIVLNGAGYTLMGSGNGTGIELDKRTNVTVTNITIRNFGCGVWLASSSGNTLSGNNVTANNQYGILLNSSSNNVLSSNNVTNSTHGIELSVSSNNFIFHNNFVDNTNQAYTAGSANVWDERYPSGGNYWSDYAGVDVKSGSSQNQPGSDGIGDTPYIIDNNNTDHYPLMKPRTPTAGHDVAVLNVVAAKTVIGEGFSGNVTALVADTGAYAETINVTVYCKCASNQTAICTIEDVALSAATSASATFSWNTTGFAYGNYTMCACAWPVPGETDTSDNNFTAGVVEVTIPGDVNGDFKVGLQDLTLIANAYRSKPDDPRWNPNADIDGNGIVGLSDLTILAQHYGQQYQESYYEWPMYRNDVYRSGYTLSPAPSTQPTSYQWKVETGGQVCSSAAVVDGKLYIGAGCSGQRTVLCLDVNTGFVIWNQTVGGTMCSSPAVAGGKVYIGIMAPEGVCCLDANTGDILWNYTIEPDMGYMVSSPAVVASKVFIGGYCFDANTGELLWQYPNATGLIWYSSPAVVGGRVYIGSNESDDEGNVTCLDENTGALIWNYTTDSPVWGAPAVVDGKVFVGTWFGGTVYCLDAATGGKMWNNTFAGGVMSSVVVAYGNVYVGTNADGKLYCLDEDTGNIKWVNETGGVIHHSSPAVTDGKVYIGTWGASSNNWSGGLLCFDAYTGNLLWKYMLPNGYVSSSAVIAYGMIFIGNDNSILAFGNPTSLYT